MGRFRAGFVGASLAISAALVIGACESSDKGGANSGAGVKTNPAAVQARAKQPPPANAAQKSSIGSGSASVMTANTPGDTDSFWIQELDIDGDGTVEQVQLLWDDEDKVLFAYAETDVPCANGGTAVVAVLVGVNGQGNPRGRAAGSGFYAITLDAMECDAAAAGLYGCTFDAAGNESAWALVVVDSMGDEIDAVVTN